MLTPHRRPLVWEGSSKKAYKRFPLEVQKDMGVALLVVQMGGMPPSAKPWKGLGPGVYEIAEEHKGNAFRAVYVVSPGDSIHVLHAFPKKSKIGIATPRPDVALITARLKALKAREVDRSRN